LRSGPGICRLCRNLGLRKARNRCWNSARPSAPRSVRRAASRTRGFRLPRRKLDTLAEFSASTTLQTRVVLDSAVQLIREKRLCWATRANRTEFVQALIAPPPVYSPCYGRAVGALLQATAGVLSLLWASLSGHLCASAGSSQHNNWNRELQVVSGLGPNRELLWREHLLQDRLGSLAKSRLIKARMTLNNASTILPLVCCAERLLNGNRPVPAETVTVSHNRRERREVRRGVVDESRHWRHADSRRFPLVGDTIVVAVGLAGCGPSPAGQKLARSRCDERGTYLDILVFVA
jgi:hypothetical protein